MNNSIINIEEYRELLRKQTALSLKAVFWIFLFVGIFMSTISFVLYMEEESHWLFMMIPAGILYILSIVIIKLIKNMKNKEYTNIYFEQYVKYETEGIKIPLFRVVSTGKSSQTISMLLDITNGIYKLFDIKKNKMELYFESDESRITTKFFFKNKNGLDIIKGKIQFLVDKKKYTFLGYQDVNDLFLNYLRNEGLKYNVQIGRHEKL